MRARRAQFVLKACSAGTVPAEGVFSRQMCNTAHEAEKKENLSFAFVRCLCQPQSHGRFVFVVGLLNFNILSLMTNPSTRNSGGLHHLNGSITSHFEESFSCYNTAWFTHFPNDEKLSIFDKIHLFTHQNIFRRQNRSSREISNWLDWRLNKAPIQMNCLWNFAIIGPVESVASSRDSTWQHQEHGSLWPA